MNESLSDYLKRQFREHYRLSLSEITIAEWVIDLKGFKYIEIVKSFDQYRSSGKNFSPTSRAIRNILFENVKEEEKKISNNACYILTCKKLGDERRSEKIWMCRQHSDDWILKTQHGSIAAKIILDAAQIECDAKNAGLSNRDYFKKENPKAFAALQKSMKEVHRNRENLFAVEDYLSGG